MTAHHNVYRLPSSAAEGSALARSHVGPYETCPQCGAKPYRCNYCGYVRTDTKQGEKHNYKCTGGGGTFYGQVDAMPFLYGVDGEHRVCSPQSRVRYGFLWLRKCKELGLHIHQHCQRCGWRGIGMIEVTP